MWYRYKCHGHPKIFQWTPVGTTGSSGPLALDSCMIHGLGITNSNIGDRIGWKHDISDGSCCNCEPPFPDVQM